MSFIRHYLEVQKRSIAGDGFLLSHATLGVLGTSKMGSPFGALTTLQIVWPDDTYIEYFDDEDFLDTDQTTADFDTTNKWVDFD